MASFSGAIIFLYKTCIFCKFVVVKQPRIFSRKMVTNGYGFSVTKALPEKRYQQSQTASFISSEIIFDVCCNYLMFCGNHH